MTEPWEQLGEPDVTVHAICSIRNEAHRWLQSSLTNTASVADTLFVWDDQSTDDSRDVARGIATAVAVRPNGVPSFIEHEGRFRQAAWNAWERTIGPAEGDWVLAIDADEFWVPLARHVPARLALQCSAAYSALNECRSTNIAVPEMWTLRPLQIRVDGQWANCFGPRLYRWPGPGATFKDVPMGCGSSPTQVTGIEASEIGLVAFGQILHFGYVHPDDLQEKYRRYSSLADHGHLSSHIESIIRPPRLAPWEGPVPPEVWRGTR